MKNSYVHPTAVVETMNIGSNSKIWQFVVILKGAKIGKDVNICSHCFLEDDVIVGDRVTIKNGVQLWNGLRVENDVFIGPNVSFTNDKYPRSKCYPEKFLETRIETNVSIGAGAVILPGIVIGTGAIIGAGAVVTKSVPPYAVVKSPPAKVTHFVTSNSKKIQSPIISNKETNLDVGNVTLHQFKIIEDERGDLSVGEFLKEIPFLPKRYFLVFNVPQNQLRGGHAHLECQQFLICIKGSCTVMVDDGKLRKEILLNKPNVGIYVPPLIWGTQYNYSNDAVLLVMTSDYYDSEDYITDYKRFYEITNLNVSAYCL